MVEIRSFCRNLRAFLTITFFPVSTTTTKIGLEFGFNPIKKKKTKTASKKKDISRKNNKVYFDEYLDTLQAPSSVSVNPAATFQFNSIQHQQNFKRSPKFLPTKLVSHSIFHDEKQDRKSNLDFLGVFDTRKYFFIPPNRRNDGQQQDGIFTKLVKIFQK